MAKTLMRARLHSFGILHWFIPDPSVCYSSRINSQQVPLTVLGHVKEIPSCFSRTLFGLLNLVAYGTFESLFGLGYNRNPQPLLLLSAFEVFIPIVRQWTPVRLVII
jgi:hypothetical protein